jgi:hypothetical protein
MTPEVRFPLDPACDKPFLTELYLRRTGDGYEIGITNRQHNDYAWAMIPKAKLDAAFALLNIEDKFDDEQ